jgi:hypothetical protein
VPLPHSEWHIQFVQAGVLHTASHLMRSERCRWLVSRDTPTVHAMQLSCKGTVFSITTCCSSLQATSEDLATKYATTSTVNNSKRYTRLKRPSTAFSLDHYAGPGT